MTWWIFLRISIEERLVYRGDFMLGTLMRFLPIVTQVFLWWAIFDAAMRDSSATDGRIVGYTREDMMAYYLLAMVSRAFSSMPGLTSGIARQIQTGEIKKFLIQPVDLIGCLLLQRTAHKLVYYLIATLPFALVFWLCRSFFPNGWPDIEVLIAFGLSLVMAFLLGFFIEVCLGLVGFWFLEITSLAFIYMLLNFFLSGHMFPLELLETGSWPIREWVEAMPLKYLAYFPAAVFLEKIPPERLWYELAIEATWLAAFVLLARFLWWRGTARYSAFGG
ncbi:MAG TPA: ABC transporter permease [Planctomycetaceae bacterium]|nr:ABC transporter permease [Planctomycetaceae bacterium]HRF02893.1 ABC-2 family transporter protein [Pirellulaceae bacterium]